jgi:hypothetical protein
MRGIPLNVLGLRVLGAAMTLFVWSAVIFKFPVVWKGGNRAPMSLRSKVVFASAVTAWFLLACGFNPALGGGLFVIAIVYSFALCDQDRASHARGRGFPDTRAATAYQAWVGFCIFDAVILFGSIYVFLRDMVRPPVTEEQILAHRLGLATLAISSIGAVSLYLRRPSNTSQ